jgi:hypothetical protein
MQITGNAGSARPLIFNTNERRNLPMKKKMKPVGGPPHPASSPVTPETAGVSMHPAAQGDRAKPGIPEADEMQAQSTAPDSVQDLA